MERNLRLQRVIARGEHSNHSHVIFGDVEFLEKCFEIKSSNDYKEAEKLYNSFSKKIKKEKDLVLKQDLQNKYNQEIEKLNVATIRHILETDWVNSENSVWTKEHIHIPLKSGTYQYIPQLEYNPLNEAIQSVQD